MKSGIKARFVKKREFKESPQHPILKESFDNSPSSEYIECLLTIKLP
jgi:hypothetical protein